MQFQKCKRDFTVGNTIPYINRAKEKNHIISRIQQRYINNFSIHSYEKHQKKKKKEFRVMIKSHHNIRGNI